jgi:phage terminase large subunit-like protein
MLSAEELTLLMSESQRRLDEMRFTSYKQTKNLKQRAFHEAKTSGRLYVGANRAGKTTAGCMEAIMWCVCGPTGEDTRGVQSRTTWFGRPLPPVPVRGRVVCPELPQILDDYHVQRDKFRELVPPHLLRKGSFSAAYSVLGHTLYFANGSSVEFKSIEQDVEKHSGESLHFVWFDEEIPRQIFNENIARLDKAHGAWWVTYTPVRGLMWMYEELYLAGLEGKKDITVVEATAYDNAMYLREGYIEETAKLLSDVERAVRLEGKYAAQRGLVYDIFGPDHLIDAEIAVGKGDS